MRKLLLITLLLSIAGTYVNAQQFPKPSPGKSLVIFERPPLTAIAIQFRLFDSTRFIGIMGAGNHLVYECDPGKRLFWGTSENRDFLEADLSPDQVYLVGVAVEPGALTARVAFVPFDPNSKRAEKIKNQFLKRLDKGKEKKIGTTLSDQNPAQTQSSVENGLQRYQTLKSKNKKIKQLTQEMHI